MATGIYQVPTENNLQYTLDSKLTAGGSTLTLNNNVSTIVSASATRPGLIVVDRVDSAGNKTSTNREYISFTGVSGADLTGLTRGLGGSTDQEHSVGSIVEFVWDVVQLQAIYDHLNKEHSHEGVHASLPSLNNVKVTNSINASGASLAGVIPIRPTFVYAGNVSNASTIGGLIRMPDSATLDWVSLTLDSPVSGASLVIDINQNGSSIFDAATRPAILGGGTFVSSASIATKILSRNDLLKAQVDNGNGEFLTIQLEGR